MRLRLRRELGLFETTAYGVGLILGAGIYVIIGEAAGLAGNALWLSFVFGAIIASLTGLSFAELGSMFPKESSVYYYTKQAFRSKFFSFLVGWIFICTAIVASATVILGFSSYLYALTGIPKILSGLVLLLLLSLVNFIGIKESSTLNIIFTSVEVLGLVLIILFGISKAPSINLLEMPKGIGGVLSATALVFFAYLGFEDIVSVSEEIKNARKIIPLALVLSIAITSLLYILTSIAAVSLANWRELAESPAPMALAASKFLGNNAFVLLSFIALFSTTNTALIMLIVASRMIYGMAYERSLPRILSKIHPTRRTPHYAILITMLATAPFLFFKDIGFVARVTNFGSFFIFILVNLSVIALRYKRPLAKRPFKIPLSLKRLPLIPLAGLILTFLLILKLDIYSIGLGLILILSGVIVYKYLEISKFSRR
ncbi:MAG TPA: amino acid permease [Candidatus Aenigmarchaeota archaeon]|nr:amino acid permease [Candidatus Aenigmarchaeota archaeon]